MSALTSCRGGIKQGLGGEVQAAAREGDSRRSRQLRGGREEKSSGLQAGSRKQPQARGPHADFGLLSSCITSCSVPNASTQDIAIKLSSAQPHHQSHGKSLPVQVEPLPAL